MDVIKFIENDVKRASRKSGWITSIFSIGVFLIPIALGLLLRDDLKDAFDPRVFIPNLLSAGLLLLVALAGYSRNFGESRIFRGGLVILTVCLLLATERVFFPLGLRTSYVSSEQFWHENARCFTKGGITTLIGGLWLLAFAFLSSSWPSRRWRAFLSATAGVSGVTMLGFHCDSSSAGHVLIAHVGQGIVLGILVFGIQELIFNLSLRRGFPELSKKLRRFYKIG